MKRVWKSSISVLLTVLMVCSMITVTLPTSVDAIPTSNWVMGQDIKTLQESSEIWVVDTVNVTMPGVTGYFQHSEKLTELVGYNGSDGKGYVNITVEDGSAKLNQSHGYVKFMLVGKSDPTQEIERKTVSNKALIWSIRGDGANSFGQIADTVEGKGILYGSHANIAKSGYRVAFTRDANNKVLIRGIGNGVSNDGIKYANSTTIQPEMALTDIPGDNGETAADGAYLRIHTGCTSTTLTVTVTVAYPLPTDFDTTQSAVSRWAAFGGSTVNYANTEYLKVDYIDAKFTAKSGGVAYIQHKALLTDFIGENGIDGKGFLNIKAFGGDTSLTDQKAFYFIQLAGKSDASTAIPEGEYTSAITWYNYSQAGYDYAGLYNQRNTGLSGGNSFKQYGTTSQFAKDGQRFVFTRDTDGHVIARAMGVGTNNNFQTYANASKSPSTLSQLVGDDGKTGEDGVYMRLASNVSSKALELQVTLAYSCEAPTTTVQKENLLPDDLLKNSANFTQWFSGGVSTDASNYTVEDGEYVYYAPKQNAWPYSIMKFPDGSFTVKMKIKPTTYISDGKTVYGGMGILLGYGGVGGFPWMNVRFNADYATKKMNFYIWEHDGSANTVSQRDFGADWYKGEVKDDKWYEATFVFTESETSIYLDGYRAPTFTVNHAARKDVTLGHFPQADELTYIGLFPSGTGHYLKDVRMYEGIVQDFVPDDVFSNYASASSFFVNAQELNAAGESCYTIDDDGNYIMRVPVVNNGNAWIYSKQKVLYNSYTVSVDFSPNICASRPDKVGGAGFTVSEIVSSGYRFHQLRFDFDKAAGTMSFRGHAQGNDPAHEYKSGIDYIDQFTVIKSGLDFSTKQWFNLTAEVTGNSIQVFLDGEQLFVEKIDRLPTAGDILNFGFMAEGSTDGFDVKNFSITEGVDGEIKTAAPELDEAITLHLQADVDVDDAKSVQMKFTFKGEEIWVDGVEADGQYTFALPDILPQDMCENISAQLYIDGMRKDKVATYSLQQYCMNLLPSAEDAAADTSGQKQKLRDVLIAMLNYGTESQKYFEGVTDAALFANSQLDAGEKTSVNQAMTNAGSVRSVGTRSDANNYWKSASLALFNTVRLRFKFVTNDASKITIKVGETPYDNFELSTGNIYYWDYDGVYAHQFDTPVVVGLYVDGVLVQEVTYSINSYVNAFVDANDESSKSYALIQAVYDYGCAASAYNP